MKVLALIENADHVCYRYRLNAYAWAMAERGLFLEGVPLGKALGTRLWQLIAAGRADVVILQRKLLPSWQLALLRRRARCLVYDLDDALFHRDSFVRKSTLSQVRLARFRATVRAADAVIAGNDYLRQYASGVHRAVARPYGADLRPSPKGIGSPLTTAWAELRG